MNVGTRWRAFLAVFAVFASVWAGTAPGGVEDSVPADAFALVKVSDLASHYDRLLASERLDAVIEAEAFQPIADGLREAKAALGRFEQRHSIDVKEVLGDILGREFALALLRDNRAVLVARGHSAEDVRRAVEALLRVEREEGKLLGSSTSDYKGVTIYHSSLRKKERFHALVDDMLAVSEHLASVQRVIDVTKGEAPSLGASAKYKEAAALMTDGALVNAYLDTTHLHPLAQALRAPEMHRKPSGRFSRAGARFIRLWLGELLPLTRSVVFSAAVDGGLTVRLTVTYGSGKLPNLLKSVLPEPESELDILKLAPSSAVFAGARNLDQEALWDAFVEMMLKEDVQEAEKAKDKLRAVIGALGGIHSERQLFEELGGQTALFVLPGEGAEDPPAAAVAVELRESAHIPLALESIGGAIAAFVQLRGRAVRPVVEYTNHRGLHLTTVRWAELTPTLCVVDGKLVLSTSAGAARRIIDAFRDGTGLGPMDVEGTIFSAARLDVGQLRGVLDRHSGFLVRQAVKKGDKSEAEARRDLAAFQAVLSLFDSAEFVSAFQRDRTDHVLAVRFAVAGP